MNISPAQFERGLTAKLEPLIGAVNDDATRARAVRIIDGYVRKLHRFWRYTRRYQRVAFLRWRAS